MREFDARHVVGRRSSLLGDPEDVSRRGEQKLGFLVDVSRDQPWAGDADNHRTFACDPFHGGGPSSEGDDVAGVSCAARLSNLPYPEIVADTSVAFLATYDTDAL